MNISPEQFKTWIDIIISMGYVGVAVLLLIRPPEWFTHVVGVVMDIIGSWLKRK